VSRLLISDSVTCFIKHVTNDLNQWRAFDTTPLWWWFFLKKNWRHPLHIIWMLKYKINMHTRFFLFFYVGTWFSIIRVKIRLYNRALLTIWNKVQHHITANTTNILILVQLNYSSCNLTNFYDSCIFTYKSLTIVTFHTRSDSSNRLTICFTWTHHLVRLARS
jgi:hypothetical protein